MGWGGGRYTLVGVILDGGSLHPSGGHSGYGGSLHPRGVTLP